MRGGRRLRQLVYLVIFAGALSVVNTASLFLRLGALLRRLNSDESDIRVLSSSSLASYLQIHEADSVVAFRSIYNQSKSNGLSTKNLWMFWEQGIEHLESQAYIADSKNKADIECVRAWKILNPTWDIRVLNKTEAMQLSPRYAVLARDTTGRHTSVKRSNILRLELLSLYGGVWADTSICPFQPLDTFVPDLLQSNGFFAPYFGGPFMAGDLSGPALRQFEDCHKFHLFGNWMSSNARSSATWFLAVDKPHNMFIDAWLDILFEHMAHVLRLKSCWNRECYYPYYITHCSFTQARMKNKTLDDAWSKYRITRQSGDPICFGKATRSHGAVSVEAARRNCSIVKKQSGDLAEFVRSGKYLNEIKQIAATGPIDK